MGILYSNAELMIEAKKNGVSFDNVLTLGHLKLFVTYTQLKKLIKKYDLNIEFDPFDEYIYSDKFFEKILGAKNVHSLDYSDYQKCDIVQDMNKSISSKYYEKYDVVIDGGTLEHIFNFPIAIANCMKVLKQGGSLFVFTMANNHLGHGFYQFSPELFFRIFQSDNGFETVEVLLEEHKFPGPELNQNSKIYKVEDPLVVKRRVGLVSKSPVLMMVHAKRAEIKNIFNAYPIQSDYVSIYERHDNGVRNEQSSAIGSIMKKLFFKLPQFLQNFLRGHLQLVKYSFKNRSFYKRVNK